MSLDSWLKVSETAEHAVTAVGVLLGGFWAYFKFIRGRTFKPRAELRLRTAVLAFADDLAVKVTVSFHNTGLSKLPFQDDFKVVRLYGVTDDRWSISRNVNWGQPLRVTRVLTDHQWAEAQEMVVDEVLIPVPNEGSERPRWVAFRVQGEVFGKGMFGSRGKEWVANSLATVGMDPASPGSPSSSSREGGDREMKLDPSGEATVRREEVGMTMADRWGTVVIRFQKLWRKEDKERLQAELAQEDERDGQSAPPSEQAEGEQGQEAVRPATT